MDGFQGEGEAGQGGDQAGGQVGVEAGYASSQEHHAHDWLGEGADNARAAHNWAETLTLLLLRTQPYLVHFAWRLGADDHYCVCTAVKQRQISPGCLATSAAKFGAIIFNPVNADPASTALAKSK